MKTNLLLSLLLICFVFSGRGVTVDFAKKKHKPADELEIGGVTITAANGESVATVHKHGLGIDGDEISRTMHYSGGSTTSYQDLFPDYDSGSGIINFQVDGIINSITVVPFFKMYSANGSLLSTQLPFEFRIFSTFQLVNPANPTPITYNVSPSSHTDVAIAGNFGEPMDFLNYRLAHYTETETFVFGITIQSLTYTPQSSVYTPQSLTPTPEPATLMLFGMGLGTFLIFRRKNAGFHCMLLRLRKRQSPSSED